jgi:hypothetical protein
MLEQLLLSIGDFHALQQLNLTKCVCLVKSPNILDALSALQQFHLTKCYMLKQLHMFIGGLSAQQQHNLTKCMRLIILPITNRNLK